MKRICVLVALTLLTTVVFAQELEQADLTGSWEVYPVSQLSRYSIKEHRNAEATTAALAGTMQLNADGSLEINLAGLTAQTWDMDEGFLLITTEGGNQFYRPRPIGQNTYFLVRVDVTELNEDIIYLNSKPQENLLIVRR